MVLRVQMRVNVCMMTARFVYISLDELHGAGLIWLEKHLIIIHVFFQLTLCSFGF